MSNLMETLAEGITEEFWVLERVKEVSLYVPAPVMEYLDNDGYTVSSLMNAEQYTSADGATYGNDTAIRIGFVPAKYAVTYRRLP
jgi:hypothetical protein